MPMEDGQGKMNNTKKKSGNSEQNQELAKFEKDPGHTELCPGVVGKAALWVVELLGEEGLTPSLIRS